MTDALIHRGPDDAGYWADADAGVALGQRRLAIIDLSAAGHQPMISAGGRYVLTYNGEIYNYRELRVELESVGCQFRGHSDSEVLLEAWSRWGPNKAIERLVGMFAIAVWDREQRILTLVRDRMGIKPLYWGQQNGLTLFGSELKALRAHEDWTFTLRRDVVARYLASTNVPGDKAIYDDVRKVEPGTKVVIDASGDCTIERYWSIDTSVDPDVSDRDATAELECLLDDAVVNRMIADVPLGAFLSGGVDSSIVAAIMQKNSTRPIKTFSVGFDDPAYDEAGHAEEVAKTLGTDHTSMYVSPSDARDVIPGLADMYDEPFADISQIPTHLVSKMARRDVTVALSGDGGDELFGGYNRHQLTQGKWRTLLGAPPVARKTLAGLIDLLSPDAWDAMSRVLPGGHRRQPGEKLRKLAIALGANNDAELYCRLVTCWPMDSGIMPGARVDAQMSGRDGNSKSDDYSALTVMRRRDAQGYLPDDVLTKVDRASMAVALEARVPLLDHRVVEFAFSLPDRMLIRGGVSKWLLRQVLYRHVPPALIERPKMGFAVPVGDWLRGPLREWSEELLSPAKLDMHGLFNAAVVQRYWSEHLSGRNNWQHRLWTLLMFQSWFERWKPSMGG